VRHGEDARRWAVLATAVDTAGRAYIARPGSPHVLGPLDSHVGVQWARVARRPNHLTCRGRA
jgi:hypothetical protein